MIVAVLIGSALGAYLTIYVAYQLLLVAANLLVADEREFVPARLRRFNVVIPAHNEELHLPRLLASLAAQGYPAGRFRVTVVADNCSDGTVAACSGFDVDVLERHDAGRKGKGHAIRWALEQTGTASFDALVIVDGDSAVGPTLLAELNLRLERGDRVIQCWNGVANPGQSWFTRLLNVSRSLSNEVLHPGKRKLGLSSHLMGNGMCFAVEVLRSHAWDAFSVGEDWEYYASLILSGVDIGYSRTARVYHQESVNLKQASSQRLRWASGRFAVLRQFGPYLMREALRRRSPRCADAALPLILPNPSLGMNLTFAGLLAAAVWVWSGGGTWALYWFGILTVAQLLLFVVGVWHTDDRMASAASLVLAPLFLAWKGGIDVLSICGVGTREWKRTERRAS